MPSRECIKMAVLMRDSQICVRKCLCLRPTKNGNLKVMMHFGGWDFTVRLDSELAPDAHPTMNHHLPKKVVGIPIPVEIVARKACLYVCSPRHGALCGAGCPLRPRSALPPSPAGSTRRLTLRAVHYAVSEPLKSRIGNSASLRW